MHRHQVALFVFLLAMLCEGIAFCYLADIGLETILFHKLVDEHRLEFLL